MNKGIYDCFKELMEKLDSEEVRSFVVCYREPTINGEFVTHTFYQNCSHELLGVIANDINDLRITNMLRGCGVQIDDEVTGFANFSETDGDV